MVGALDPEAVHLFGSRARGDATPYRDFDILVVTSSNGARGEIGPAEAYAPLLGIARGGIACSREDFQGEKTGICLPEAVLREGRLLCGRL